MQIELPGTTWLNKGVKVKISNSILMDFYLVVPFLCIYCKAQNEEDGR